MSICDFRFVTIEELAKRLMEAKDGYDKMIGFTFDNDESIKEPTGWYGVMRTYMFDGEALLFGYFGAGILRVENINEEEDDVEAYIRAIWSFYRVEIGGCEFPSEPDKSTILCVDSKEFDECLI